MALDEQARELVQEIKAAITKVQSDLESAELQIAKVELELKMTVTKKAEGGFEFKLFEIGGEYSVEDTDTLAISLIPIEDEVDQLSGVDEDLRQGILAVAWAAAEAAATSPRFDLEEAEVTMGVEKSSGGKVKLIVGGGGTRAKGHTISMTLKSA